MSDIVEELKRGAEMEEEYDADGIIRIGYKRSLRYRAADEIERLRGLLADAPCTCPNSPPWDWPHDPHNEDCYLNRIREALGDK